MSQMNTYQKAHTVEEALTMARQAAVSYRFVAGGTDVMVNRAQGNDLSAHLIDISEIAALQQIQHGDAHLGIGSLVRLEQLIHSPVVEGLFPVLVTAARSVASPVIRKTATLAGNLLCQNRCSFYNQSEWWREAAGFCLKSGGDTCLASGGKKHCYAKFVSDMAIPLIALRADIEWLDETGLHRQPLERIYTGDGLHPTTIGGNSIVTSIFLPTRDAGPTAFMKLRKRAAVDFTSLTVSVNMRLNGALRIVLGGVHAAPVVVEGGPDALPELLQEAVSKTRILDNDTYSRKYRKDMISVFITRCFQALQSSE